VKAITKKEAITMPRVIHFELETTNPEQTIAFYESVFGWQFRKLEGIGEEYWLITTGSGDEPGINGGMMHGREEIMRTINTIDVPSLDEYLGKVEAAGGKVLTPKMTIPNVGQFAYCADPQGIQFGVIQLLNEQTE
jgi:predicted enzyme related to lactoylglutathione lyase